MTTKTISKTERARLVPCPRCNAVKGQSCTLVVLNPNDPLRAERHEMNRCHSERYLESVGVEVE